MARVAIPIAVVAGSLCAAVSFEEMAEALPYWLVWGSVLAGPFIVGCAGGGRGILVFAAVLVAVTLVGQIAFWHDDPELQGIDDIPPLGGALLILFFGIPIAVLGHVVGIVASRGAESRP